MNLKGKPFGRQYWVDRWNIFRFQQAAELFASLRDYSFSERIRYHSALLRTGRVSGIHPAEFFFSKRNQRSLFELLGARTPRLEYIGPAFSVPQLPCGKYIVKPESGSSGKSVIALEIDRGAWLVAGEQYSQQSALQLLERIYSRQTLMVEHQLLAAPGKMLIDYKAYCFFGGAVDHLLCVKNSRPKQYATVDASGTFVETGKYESLEFDGALSAESVKLVSRAAEEMARKIPLSFFRLDMFVVDGVVSYGEITPLPGQASQFSKAYDRKLGEQWCAAEIEAEERGHECLAYEFFNSNRIFMY